MIRPVYELSIDPNDAQEGEYLGFWDIANTATPAIEIKGIAFSKVKELFFKDDLKYRIAAPVLVPGKVFRRDEETGEEYYVNIKPEVVEQMFMKFQQDRAGKQVFNDEHNESERIPSFILEAWLVETPETDKSFVTYGIKCPPKTIFAVQQFTDKDAYHKCVEEGKTGFSIHGSGALKLSINGKQNYSDVIVFNEDGKVLLLKRTSDDEFEPNKYSFPGGKIEKGEDPIIAGIRELNEETGLGITKVNSVASELNEDGSTTHYFTTSLKGDLKLSDEHVGSEWFAIEDIKNIDVIMGQNERFIEICQKSKTINKPISMSKQMKKRKFVAHFSEATETDGNEIIVTADELVEGAEVVVVDENFQPVDGFSGEVTIDDQPVVIEGDVVKSIGTTEETTEEVEMAEEPAEEVAVEMTEDEPKTEEVEVEMEEVPVTETYTKGELDAKFDEIYALIAEAKAEAPAPQADIQMSAIELSGVQLQMAKLESITKFLKS